MGLCKCRVVTNLFCFEHKTNVCEKCIVATHTRCVVKSYLQWLQDSDYDNTCGLCHTPLATSETIRLSCLDVFHRTCIDSYASALPEHTAPSGYACPNCSIPIIPPENASSPVAVSIRQALRTSPWARPILGIQEALASGNGNGVDGSVNARAADSATDKKALGAPIIGSAIASQAVSSRKPPPSIVATAAAYLPRSSASLPNDADEELHKYKQRRGYLTRLLQMSFWHLNSHGDLVLNVPRLLLFLCVVSLVVTASIIYSQQTDLTTKSIVMTGRAAAVGDDDSQATD